MSAPSRLRAWLRGIFRRNAVHREVEAELQFHIDAYAADLIRQGLPPEEARRTARVELGPPAAQPEKYRAAVGLRPFDELGSDIRFGIRSLWKQPSFSLVAVLSLALGIGATTAMFSLIYAVLLHPFPYANADRIVNPVIVNEQHPDEPQWFPVDKAQFDELRRAAPVDSLLGFNNSHMEVTGGALPESVYGVYLTENAGAFFGVRPLLGRSIEPADAENGGRPVVVLNFRFWMRHFGGDTHVIGRALEIDHASYTIVGVMPRSFAFNDTTGVGDVYLPCGSLQGIANHPCTMFIPWIKLRPHVTLAAANAALEPLVRQFAKQDPERFPDRWHVALQPIVVPYRQDTGRTLALLLAGVVLLLVIGCVNCSILQLARGRTRQHELAIRSAIGAGRWRIVRQLLVEAVVISFTGAALGVASSYWLAKLPLLLSPESFPAESVIRINGPILAFCVSLALVCGILFGLVPALRLSRQDLARSLHGRRIGAMVTPVKHRWSVLISAQVALTLLLMATAGTAIQSFLRITRMPLGYDPANVMALGIMLHVQDPGEWKRIHAREARISYIEQIRKSIASIRGVSTVAVCTDATPPYAGTESSFTLDGTPDREQTQARVILIDQRYFAALRIPVLHGRIWNADENVRGDFVAVVNRAFAMRYLSGFNFLGRQLRIPGLTPPNRYDVSSPQSTAWRQIVGVVGDARNDGIDRPIVPSIYLPYTTVMLPYVQFLVRSQGDPFLYLHSIRAAVASVFSDQQVSNGALTLNQAIERDPQYSRQRLFSVLFGVFSAMALALALAGIFSVVAYSVAQRTTEFGVRLALGASRGHILWVGIRTAALSLAVGAAAGSVFDFFLGRWLSSWMNTRGAGPLALPGAAAVLVAGALLACLIAARRAALANPSDALRCE